MAEGDLIFCDGFDVDFADDETGLWTGKVDGGTGTTLSHDNTKVRTGDGALKVVSSSNINGQLEVYHDVSALSLTDVTFGFAIYPESLVSYYGNWSTFARIIMNGGDHVHINLNRTTGKVVVTTDEPQTYGTVRGTSNSILHLDTWTYFEISWEIDGASGYFTLRMNGGEEIALTGNTDWDTYTDIASVRLGFPAYRFSRNANGTAYYDDFVLLDATGAAGSPTWPNGARVVKQDPGGTGNYDQWTRTDATAPENDVDDVTSWGGTPDDDTTVLTHGTVSERSSWATSNSGYSNGNVLGVQLATWAKGNGADQMATFLRASATDYDNTTFTPGTSYGWQLDVLSDNPDTSSPFTLSEVDAIEAGVVVK